MCPPLRGFSNIGRHRAPQGWAMDDKRTTALVGSLVLEALAAAQLCVVPTGLVSAPCGQLPPSAGPLAEYQGDAP